MADDGISLAVEGLSDLQAKLDALTKKQGDRCIRTALKAGAVIEQAAISERAPIHDGTGGTLPPGALASDIVIRFIQDVQGAISAKVGPAKLTAHVARWVEYGHRIVQGGRSRVFANGKIRGPGKAVGVVEAHPFIRTAYEASRQAVITVICTTLATELERVSKTKGTT
jgi:HK97 gp10 family phage protein